jgi:hypothetical protein
MTSAWGDKVPDVKWVEEDNRDVWFFGEVASWLLPTMYGGATN